MGADGALVGRDTELSTIAAFLQAETAEGLVLLGEAGLGKSALWQSAGRLATELGMLTLEATLPIVVRATQFLGLNHSQRWR